MSWRVFAALELSSELQQQLARLQVDLKAAVPARSVRWVRAEGIHLTLKFYGDIDPARLPELQAGLGRAAAVAAPMPLTVADVGVFPNASRPSVIWVGVSGQTEPLRQLQAAVEREAIALGFSPEGREYRPHLTVGRVNAAQGGGQQRRSREERRQGDVSHSVDVSGLMEALAEARGRRFGSFRPEYLSLMNSELKPGGSVYTQLYRTPLATLEQAS